MGATASLTRSALLKLSESGALKRAVTSFGPSVRASRRFIAGERLEEALQVVAQLNAEGKLATLDYLGENVASGAQATAYTQTNRRILEAIAAQDLDCNLSVKLTGMGLDLDTQAASEGLRAVLETARATGNFVWTDMEGSAYTERTLAIHREARRDFANVGVAIQSYLRRSEADVEALVAQGASVRLCKGAYQEPPAVAFPDKRDVDESYRVLSARLLSRGAHAKGVRAAIATHDPVMLDAARREAEAQGLSKADFEFQMLYGIRRDLQEELVRQGFALRVYVPFGEAWYPYFMRRLAERPANVGFLLKNLWREA